MGVYEKFSAVNDMECRTYPMSEERNMQCWLFQIGNGTVDYFQTPFNVSFVEQSSNNNNMFLRENIEMDKDSCMK